MVLFVLQCGWHIDRIADLNGARLDVGSVVAAMRFTGIADVGGALVFTARGEDAILLEVPGT